jgi:hypothetical protein
MIVASMNDKSLIDEFGQMITNNIHTFLDKVRIYDSHRYPLTTDSSHRLINYDISDFVNKQSTQQSTTPTTIIQNAQILNANLQSSNQQNQQEEPIISNSSLPPINPNLSFLRNRDN